MATLSGGTLTITTVDQFGGTEVLAGDNNQLFDVVGGALGEVTLHTGGATMINGGVADVAFTGVTSVVLDLKLGNDNVFCSGLNLLGDLTFKGGEGENILTVDGNGGATNLRNLTVTNGDGFARTDIRNGTMTLSGTLTVTNGDGGSNLTVGAALFDDVTIMGAVKITSGGGNDDVTFRGDDVRMEGAVAIKGGNGENTVTFAADNSLVVTKALSIVNGAGADVFNVNNVNKTSSFAAVTINNGLGGSDVTFGSNVSDTINGNLTVTAGAGEDSFTARAPSFAVTGVVKIANGGGGSTTRFMSAMSNKVDGALAVTNAAGDDSLTISGAVVSFNAVTVSNGNGDSETEFNGGDLTFGSVSIINKDGEDEFNVSASTDFELTGGLTIRNGAGDTETIIEAAGTAAIARALSITNGDGFDTVTIGDGAGNFSGLHAVTISHGNGGSTNTFNPAQFTLTGSLSLTAGDEQDLLTIGNGALTSFTITGSAKVITGSGDSNTVLNPSVVGAITGQLTVTTTDGSDLVSMLRMAIGGATKLTVGNADDSVFIDNSALAALTISSGAGSDSIRLENNSNFNGVGTTLNGALRIDAGVGDDYLLLGLDADDFVTAKLSVKLIGGLGLDTYDQEGAVNAFTLPPVLSGLEVLLP